MEHKESTYNAAMAKYSVYFKYLDCYEKENILKGKEKDRLMSQNLNCTGWAF